MTPITKQQVEELIGRLADKGLTFGCLVKDYASGKTMRYAGKHFEDVRMKDFYAYYSLWNGEQELFRERNDDFTYPENRIIGHPILIGDVLEKIDTHKAYISKDGLRASGYTLRIEVMQLWADCGFTKSLQEIAEGATWEWVPVQVPDDEFDLQDGPFKTVQVLKDEKVEALVSFLISLDLLREGKFNNNAK